MEEKLDGERMQLHMRGSAAQWFYCSRKAKDYSERLYSDSADHSLPVWRASGRRQLDAVHLGCVPRGRAQVGAEVFKANDSVILDGEMMVWDPILEKYLAFGTLKTAAGGEHLVHNQADIRSRGRRERASTLL